MFRRTWPWSLLLVGLASSQAGPPAFNLALDYSRSDAFGQRIWQLVAKAGAELGLSKTESARLLDGSVCPPPRRSRTAAPPGLKVYAVGGRKYKT